MKRYSQYIRLSKNEIEIKELKDANRELNRQNAIQKDLLDYKFPFDK